MSNKQIIEDDKVGIFHPGFAVLYCEELNKHVISRLCLDESENDFVLLFLTNSNIPPASYEILTKSSGEVVKRTLNKRVPNKTIMTIRSILRNLKGHLMMFCKRFSSLFLLLRLNEQTNQTR
jgi:hypothetical protein